ncbi:MAG TPA: TetR/AcrR family transcriptional regulator [Candidatus Dormibacteraeota bacterium]|jgi:AcrR family transcriptional regulator|nr:TetR/AcrR family transcriptional regulator [Candidatus Dormibacteraeota bacterium]
MTGSRRGTGEDARARLLRAVLSQVEERGISDLSLRELAAAIGTSHRMLIYHFGSKEGLEVAVVQAVEQAQRAFLAQLLSGSAVGPVEIIGTMWRRLADPGLSAQERLFFEIYGLALQGRPGTAGFLDGVVDAWVDAAAAYAISAGLDEGSARADARLGVAVMRGLLLDLLATGDRPAVDEAVERYIELYRSLPPA